MTEPTPTYTAIPDTRAQLAEYRKLVNRTLALQAELMKSGAITRPSIISRRMLHGERMASRPRRIDTA